MAPSGNATKAMINAQTGLDRYATAGRRTRSTSANTTTPSTNASTGTRASSTCPEGRLIAPSARSIFPFIDDTTGAGEVDHLPGRSCPADDQPGDRTPHGREATRPGPVPV